MIGSCSQRQAEIEDKLYASPEELLHKPLTAASDVYSLVHLLALLLLPLGSGSSDSQSVLSCNTPLPVYRLH